MIYIKICIYSHYITKISIYYTQAYNILERDVFKALQGRFLKSLATVINMLLYDREVMEMDSDS
jgi:hypothetical protein